MCWCPSKELLGSTTSTHKICQRMDNVLRGNVFHITQSQVLIGRNGLCHHISLNKGIESKEPTCYGKFWKRHPSLPLMFVYPNSLIRYNCGELMVTTDITHQDDVIDRPSSELTSYNGGTECIAKTSSRKRLFDFEEEIEEQIEENFLL